MKPFNVDSLNVDNWDGFRPAMKRPIVIHACQMNLSVGFSVTTLEGTVVGKPGDYLMIGIDGEKYPCAKDIFERSYDFTDECVMNAANLRNLTDKANQRTEARLKEEGGGQDINEQPVV